jgi:RND family efflux transporter MFP subunit
VDIGSHVKKGQLLAVIDVPEVNQQLQQARANLATADARANLAQTTSARYQELIKTDSVSKQDVDMAVGDLAARRAEVASARANVQRLEQMLGFSRIYAPFDGVVTARNIDVGALIDAGSGPQELFHLNATDRLRVFVDVPEIYAPAARPGLPATISLNELPNRRFTGTLVRTARAIDMTTRTLRTEVDVDNPTGELLPGAYAEVTLQLPTEPSSLRVPVSVLIFRTDTPQIAIVHDNRLELRTVALGHDYGTTVEVTKGLTGDEQMVVNPLDSLTPGQTVRSLATPDIDATR